MTKKEAIKWADHFPRNENLWFGVLPFNDGYIVYDSNHIKRHPSLEKKIVYSNKNKF
jgi:hypothetical protein